jgi:DNA phosphorothioation-dependent restriction protein DptG
MTIFEQVKFLKEERYQDLNAWCKEFISDLYEHAQDDDELTQRQKDKVEEIWMDLGL